MNAAFTSSLLPSSTAAKLPMGSSAAEALAEICRGMGISPLSAEEAASLPPWTEEEADAFERTVHEAFEQVEESPKLL